MAECRICGCVFDEKKAERIDCNCGCGGDIILCPNCGYTIKLNTNNNKEQNQGFFKKIVNSLRMGY